MPLLNSQAVKSNHYKCNIKKFYPAEIARIEAGLTLEQAAKRLHLAPRYLRQIERKGNASIKTARRLARLYGCSGNFFIFPPEYFAHLGQRTIQASSASPTAGADTSRNACASRRHQPPRAPILTLVTKAQSEVGQ